MNQRYSIQGGRVMDPANQRDEVLDVHIEKGRILALGEAPEGFAPDHVVSAEGCKVCPGLVDLGARLREPGLEHKATIRSETRAAAAGGITTLCVPPDTDPVLDTPAVAELLLQLAQDSNQSQILPIGALTRRLRGEHLAEMGDLHRAGCVAVSNAGYPIANTQVLYHALRYAANFHLPVMIQPREAWLDQPGVIHAGKVAVRLGLSGIHDAAETIEVSRVLMLAEETGARIHFCRLSTARAVELITQARGLGLPITADVAMHQLFLTDHDVQGFNSAVHVQPPFRLERDRDALRAGLMNGAISAICSDHQPHDADAKQVPFAEAQPGISGLDTLLPLSIRLAEAIGVSWSRVLPWLTTGPAAVLGKPHGTLQPGRDADLFVLDPQFRRVLTAKDLLSQGKNSPFIGWELPGQVTHTWVKGKLVFSRA